MKRMMKAGFVLFLLLSLCFSLTSASAQIDPEALQIQNITVSHDGDDTILKMTFYNAGSTAIDEFGLALAFLDEEGYQLYGYADTPDGYTYEICNWYYTPEYVIEPGELYKTEDTFANYADAEMVAVAIRYYYALDTGYVRLPESQWQWIWTGNEAQSGILNREYYTSPPESLYAAIGDFNLGYQFYLLDDYNASFYDKNQGGEWITQVEPGSPAALAGLQVGDLVLFADGVKPTENYYAVEYAMAAIVAGEKVDWVYERDGVIYVTRIMIP